MSESTHKNTSVEEALSDYFGDLLSLPDKVPGEEEAVGHQAVPEDQARPITPNSELVADKMSPPSETDAKEERESPPSTNLGIEPQTGDVSLDDATPSSDKHFAKVKKHELHPQASPKAQSDALPIEQLAILEEEKRQKLQKLLAQQAVSKVAPKVATEPVVKVELEVKEKCQEDQPVQTIQTTTQQVEKITETKQDVAVNDVLEWCENGRPVWAQSQFDALLFEVAGLTLAVPLIALGHIVPLDKNLTPIFGQSEWFMGLLTTPHGDYKTVNTALFVMPEKYKASFKDLAKYVISIDGMSWGLAVDKVNQPVTLSPEDVKWRTNRTSRAWLAGTVKEKMCALLDVPQVAHLLNTSDKSLSPN